ncbi:MAG: TetR family transcriptional regulator, partial [Pseudomonadota bacterium]|nr:TetR family transcriptional regulator [Pseudomonadota bacterium]
MPRRTKEEALQTRETLIEAAEVVFHRKGVSASSLNDIAKEAGVTRGAVYWHFKNKHDIFQAIVDRLLAPL